MAAMANLPAPVDPGASLPEMEQGVLERWRERDVFAESLRRREGAEPWVFYEGPPTANGTPHNGPGSSPTNHRRTTNFPNCSPRSIRSKAAPTWSRSKTSLTTGLMAWVLTNSTIARNSAGLPMVVPKSEI